MRKSLILRTTNRLLTGMLLVFSIFLLLRGHNLPGGGFSGGLVAGCAFVLQALSHGVDSARKILVFHPRSIIAAGLLIAVVSGVLGWFFGLPFLTGLWDTTPLPIVGKLGTPLLFDVGVYVLVLGVVSLLVFELGEEGESWK